MDLRSRTLPQYISMTSTTTSVTTSMATSGKATTINTSTSLLESSPIILNIGNLESFTLGTTPRVSTNMTSGRAARCSPVDENARIVELEQQIRNLQTSLSNARPRSDVGLQNLYEPLTGNNGVGYGTGASASFQNNLYDQRYNQDSVYRTDFRRDDNLYHDTSGYREPFSGPNHVSWDRRQIPISNWRDRVPERNMSPSIAFRRRSDEPKPRLPIFTGKAEWKPFWIQFQLMTTRYGWSEYEQGEQLMFCLKDDALVFASNLSIEIRSDTDLFVRAMKQRFGDHVLAETHRMNLQNIRKFGRESMQEYTSRVSTAMAKSYPGLDNTSQLFTNLTIEHLLNGLTDQSLAYDVMTKKPSTLEEALEMLTWHECCKGGIGKKSAVRQIKADCHSEANEYWDKSDVNVRRVNSQNFITETRLEQFGKDLRDSLIKDISTAVIKEIKTSFEQEMSSDVEMPVDNRERRQRAPKCFSCNEVGHFSRNCPLQSLEVNLESEN